MRTANNLQLEVTNRQILRMALPISLAMLVPQLNFITNNIFLGHYEDGGVSLAIASLTGVYYLIFAAIGYGLNNGLQALISRRAGENRPDAIGKIFNQGIYISLGISIVGILLTYFVAPYIFREVLHSEVIYEKAMSFLRIRIWGLPFLFVYQMRNALMVGTNNTKFLVFGTAAEAIANVFFDYALIFGNFGFPELGFNGAAVASIIAEFTGMFVMFLVVNKSGIGKRFSVFNSAKLDTASIGLILAVSSPLIFQHGISIISWEFFYVLVEHHGDQALGISNIMRNIFGFSGVLIWAFAATTNTMVSNIIGQGRNHDVIPLINRIMKLSIVCTLFMSLALLLVPDIFIRIFGQDEKFIEAAIPVVRVVSLAMMLMSIGSIWLNAVTGTGNSRRTLKIEIVAIVIYSVYVYLVLEEYKLSITYGWMSEWLYWTTLFTLSFLYIRSGKWRGKKI